MGRVPVVRIEYVACFPIGCMIGFDAGSQPRIGALDVARRASRTVFSSDAQFERPHRTVSPGWIRM